MGAFLAQNWPAILCLLAGVGLLILEAFLPGFGAAGFSGIVLEIAAVVLVWLQTKSFIAAALMLLIGLVVAATALTLSLRSAAKGKLSQSDLILRGAEREEDGYQASEDMKVFLGREGTTVTVLRPTGMAEFDGVKLNVISDGEYIEKDTPVCITRVDGNRILVHPQA
jgi:membrane-bound ClpP family serine protease